jgi:hypothetical protein
MTVTGREIDEAMGRQDFYSKDVMEIYNAAVNITAQRGMLGSSQGFKETSKDAINTTKMAATLIATAVGCRRQSSSIHDSMWQSV